MPENIFARPLTISVVLIDFEKERPGNLCKPSNEIASISASACKGVLLLLLPVIREQSSLEMQNIIINSSVNIMIRVLNSE